jgi:hypothetical protein
LGDRGVSTLKVAVHSGMLSSRDEANQLAVLDIARPHARLSVSKELPNLSLFYCFM